MKKVLFVATVVKTHINTFHLPFLKMFKENGWETAVCAKNDFENPADCNIPHCDKFYDTPFERFPFKPNNIKAFFALRKLIKREQYDIIHCHTPSGGVLARLAAIGTKKKGCRVIYTAHGFHFFKGAPLLNWLIYCPIEWVCSFFTDTLITINKEDYAFAKKHMHAKQIEYVPGVGIDVDTIDSVSVDREQKREELGIPKDSVAVLSVGELNENKNHETVLRAIASLDRKDIVYVICGEGEKREFLLQLAKELNMAERLILLGYRSDVYEINKCCDIFAFPSLREGLPISLLEALACGLPAVVSKIRGNVDLIEDGKNGFLCNRENTDQFAEKILRLADRITFLTESTGLRSSFLERGQAQALQFALQTVKAKLSKIYEI